MKKTKMRDLVFAAKTINLIHISNITRTFGLQKIMTNALGGTSVFVIALIFM